MVLMLYRTGVCVSMSLSLYTCEDYTLMDSLRLEDGVSL